MGGSGSQRCGGGPVGPPDDVNRLSTFGYPLPGSSPGWPGSVSPNLLKYLCCRQAHVLGSDCQGLLGSGGNQRAPGQMIGFAIKPPGALVDGGNGGRIIQVSFNTGNLQVMADIGFHPLPVNSFQMAPGHHPGGQWSGGAVHELVDQIGLTG